LVFIKIGYFQGLNFIFSVLLYHSEEYMAFWLFDSIFEKYQLHEIYSANMYGVFKHISLIEIIYSINFPKLKEKLVN